MANSKVELFGETLIDISNDTVNADNLLKGVTAHNHEGEPVVGNVITHNVVDTLESDSTEDALSANKGKELKKLVDKKADIDDIPAEITEETVEKWGFTKNTGDYSKPADGIPKTDLSTDVQTSLGKADTALQEYTETDPTVPAWAKAENKPTYTAEEVGAISSTDNNVVFKDDSTETVQIDDNPYLTQKDIYNGSDSSSVIRPASANQIKLLNERIDNLVIASGDSPAEVEDARVGVNGTAYATLKNRIDTENNQIKQEMNQSISLIDNTISFKNGFYISVGMGDEGEEAGGASGVFCSTSFIDVHEYVGKYINVTTMIYTTSSGIAPANGLCFYDSNKNYIVGSGIRTKKGTRAYEISKVFVPSNAHYIRSTFYIDSKNEYSVTYDGTIKDVVIKNPYKSGNIFFQVEASKYNGDRVYMNAVMRLPKDYNKNGKPSPVLLIGHGTNGMVSTDEWYSSDANFDSWMEYLTDAGYVVFDVDNVYADHTTGEKIEFGCIQSLNAYHNAFNWIKKHYNVESQLCIIGASQGSAIALNS